jgi:hypothetical protein
VITYSATLDVPTDTTTLLTDLLIAERRRRGTGIGARAATCRTQAILVLRWFREDTGMPTLARDAGVSQATGYRYLHEGIDVLAARAPDLNSALEQGKAAGWSHVVLDGTLLATDRCRTTNPDTGHDLWYSGSTAPTAETCRSSAIRRAFRSRSPTRSRARCTTSPPPGPPGSSVPCTPRPRCSGYPRWPTRATTAPASACTRRPRAPAWPRPPRPAISC